MLYDKRWDAKIEPFSVPGVIVWLEKQPADKHYNWFDSKECLACRYLESLGYDEPWYDFRYADAFGNIENYLAIAGQEPWTYGAALARARAAI